MWMCETLKEGKEAWTWTASVTMLCIREEKGERPVNAT